MTQASLFNTGQFSDWLEALRAGEPRTFGPLSMVPLHASAGRSRDYLLLSEALAAGTFRVTEVSQGGSVPELLAVNQGDRPVLLIDGEELVGAKQNRILNLSVLVAAHSELKIPVSCVEQGRWQYKSAAFEDAGRALFAKARAQKSRDVTQSLAQGTRATNQGGVWRAVAEKLDELSAASPTGALSAAYEQSAHSLSDYVNALTRLRVTLPARATPLVSAAPSSVWPTCPLRWKCSIARTRFGSRCPSWFAVTRWMC